MPIDCDQLRECADLLHDKAASEMESAQREGRHLTTYVDRMRVVAELEGVAEVVEAKLSEAC